MLLIVEYLLKMLKVLDTLTLSESYWVMFTISASIESQRAQVPLIKYVHKDLYVHHVHLIQPVPLSYHVHFVHPEVSIRF